MSIYASMGAPTDEHLLTCAKWVQEKVPGALVTTLTMEGAFELDDSQPCTCGLVDTPIKFIDSGHYPDPEKDGREGYLDIAYIPGHVSRPEDEIEPTNGELAVLYDRDDGVCYLCLEYCAWEDATVDHKYPLVLAGSHTYDNVALAHRICNCRKGSKILERGAFANGV